MNLRCVRCNEPFECANARGYCDECIEHFKGVREGVHKRQRPAPGVFADGQFAKPKECPESVIDPVSDKSICGLCGGDQLENGFGLGSGYGYGCYNFCLECNTFLDFRESHE